MRIIRIGENYNEISDIDAVIEHHPHNKMTAAGVLSFNKIKSLVDSETVAELRELQTAFDRLLQLQAAHSREAARNLANDQVEAARAIIRQGGDLQNFNSKQIEQAALDYKLKARAISLELREVSRAAGEILKPIYAELKTLALETAKSIEKRERQLYEDFGCEYELDGLVMTIRHLANHCEENISDGTGEISPKSQASLVAAI